VASRIAAGIGGAWDTFKNAVKNVVGGLWQGINEIWGNIWNLGKQIASNIASGLTGAWDSFKNNIKGVLGAIWNGIVEKWGEFWNWGKQLTENIAAGIYGAWNKFTENMKGVLGAVWNGIVEKWNEMWGWGKQIAENIANGIYGAWDKIKHAASWIANVFKSFLGWFSPPEEGPMSTGDKWMPNMMKTLAEGIKSSMPAIQGAVSDVGNTIMGIEDVNPQPIVGTQFTQGTEPYATGVAAPAPTVTPETVGQGETNVPQKVININPGMMVASQGEIRQFIRMLQPYLQIEETRKGAD